MKVLIDALAATKYSGGMKLHAREFINAWAEEFPSDRIIVITGSALAREIDSIDGVKALAWPNESIALRAPGQLVATAITRLAARVDVTISLSPIVTPFAGRDTYCFQHDWRHRVHPEEFSRIQRAYRSLWAFSASRATLNICISEKAQLETKQYAPGARTIVVENGRDHPRDWQPPRNKTTSSAPMIVTFGHHNNKRPELVIDAVANLLSDTSSTARLTVLGARGDYADELRGLARARGIELAVDLPGFVPEADYQHLIQTASCIVLASTDEGFGLPLAEAEYFGIPSVITIDSGVGDLFQHALTADPTPISLAEAISRALDPASPRPRRVTWRWRDGARAVRTQIAHERDPQQ